MPDSHPHLTRYFAQLREQREQALAPLQPFDREQLWLRNPDGQWSPGEHLTHLVKVGRALGNLLTLYLPVASPVAWLLKGRAYNSEPVDIFQRPEYKGMQAMASVRPIAADRANALETLTDDLEQTLARLEELLYRRSESVLGHIRIPYPIAKSINLVQLGSTMAAHEAHHFRKVENWLRER